MSTQQRKRKGLRSKRGREDNDAPVKNSTPVENLRKFLILFRKNSPAVSWIGDYTLAHQYMAVNASSTKPAQIEIGFLKKEGIALTTFLSYYQGFSVTEHPSSDGVGSCVGQCPVALVSGTFGLCRKLAFYEDCLISNRSKLDLSIGYTTAHRTLSQLGDLGRADYFLGSLISRVNMVEKRAKTSQQHGGFLEKHFCPGPGSGEDEMRKVALQGLCSQLPAAGRKREGLTFISDYRDFMKSAISAGHVDIVSGIVRYFQLSDLDFLVKAAIDVGNLTILRLLCENADAKSDPHSNNRNQISQRKWMVWAAALGTYKSVASAKEILDYLIAMYNAAGVDSDDDGDDGYTPAGERPSSTTSLLSLHVLPEVRSHLVAHHLTTKHGMTYNELPYAQKEECVLILIADFFRNAPPLCRSDGDACIIQKEEHVLSSSPKDDESKQRTTQTAIAQFKWLLSLLESGAPSPLLGSSRRDQVASMAFQLCRNVDILEFVVEVLQIFLVNRLDFMRGGRVVAQKYPIEQALSDDNLEALQFLLQRDTPVTESWMAVRIVTLAAKSGNFLILKSFLKYCESYKEALHESAPSFLLVALQKKFIERSTAECLIQLLPDSSIPHEILVSILASLILTPQSIETFKLIKKETRATWDFPVTSVLRGLKRSTFAERFKPLKGVYDVYLTTTFSDLTVPRLEMVVGCSEKQHHHRDWDADEVGLYYNEVSPTVAQLALVQHRDDLLHLYRREEEDSSENEKKEGEGDELNGASEEIDVDKTAVRGDGVSAKKGVADLLRGLPRYRIFPANGSRQGQIETLEEYEKRIDAHRRWLESAGLLTRL